MRNRQAGNLVLQTGNGNMRFFTNNTEKMIILSNGNVGIGDLTPLALFTVGNGDLFRVQSSGHVRTINASVAAPAYSFTESTTTGLWSPGTNVLAFSTNGVERARILSTKEFLVNSTILIDPASSGDAFSSFITASTNNWAINGVNTSTAGGGVYGSNTNTGNGYNAFEGVTHGTYSGVYALHITSSGTGYGLYGATNSPSGFGVYGKYPGGALATGWAGYFVGEVYSTAGFYFPSDRNFKKDIDPIDNALSILSSLQPMQYNYDLEKYPNAGFREGKSFGFIADELEAILPELVRNSKIDLNGTKDNLSKSKDNADWQPFKAVDYMSLIPILTKATQEQQEIIVSLEQRISELEKLVER